MRLSSSISYIVLAGTSVYCLIQTGIAADFPQTSFTILTVNSVIGAVMHLMDEELSDPDSIVQQIERFSRLLRDLFCLPCITTTIWLKYGYQKELAWAHTGVALIPFIFWILDQGNDKQLVDLIITINAISLGVVSFLAENWWGVGAAVLYFFAEFGFRRQERHRVEMSNFCLAGWAYCSLRAITG